MLPTRRTVLCVLASFAAVRLVSKSVRSRRCRSSDQSEPRSQGGDVKVDARQRLDTPPTPKLQRRAAWSGVLGWHAFAGGGWLAFAVVVVLECWGVQAAVVVGLTLSVLSVVYLHALAQADPLPETDETCDNLSTQLDLSGTWLKDVDASDSMEHVLKAMQLNPIVRAATRLVRGLELKQTEDSFKVSVFSVIRWFKIHEEYPFSGAVKQFPRRDLRRGKQRGSVAWAGSTLRLTVEWDDPLGGWGTDEFKLISHDELHVETSLKRTGEDALRYKIVYRRKT